MPYFLWANFHLQYFCFVVKLYWVVHTRYCTIKHFYRAMLCIRGTSHCPVSVCPSVTSRCSTKTARRRITQTTPHDSPGTLVFGCQRSPRNSTGITPCGGAKYRWGGSKSATFDKLLAISRKRYKIDACFLLKSNRKLYALYWMVTLPLTLSAP